MKIDEERQYPLSSYLRGKQKHSDHFSIIVDFDISFRRQKPIRDEQFNFKDIEGQKIYTNILNNEENLTKCFLNDMNLEDQIEKWLTELNKIFQRSFKKVRFSGKMRETEVSQLQKKRSDLIHKMKTEPNNDELKIELEDIIENITKLVSKENSEKIMKNFQHLDQSEGENFSTGIWKLKNKEFSKVNSSVPSAKTDINGRKVSDPNGLKKLYLDTFVHRLRQRPSKDDYSDLYELQKGLLDKRLLTTIEDKSLSWTVKDITQVLKSLKNGKCRDPLGLINEIFKPPVAGLDLIRSLIIMMNRVHF